MSKTTLEGALGIVDRHLNKAGGFSGIMITVEDLEKVREAIVTEITRPKPIDTTGLTGMDPGCFYAKSCGFDPGTCPVCNERKDLPGDGIYYGDEIGQLAPEGREN